MRVTGKLPSEASAESGLRLGHEARQSHGGQLDGSEGVGGQKKARDIMMEACKIEFWDGKMGT